MVLFSEIERIFDAENNEILTSSPLESYISDLPPESLRFCLNRNDFMTSLNGKDDYNQFIKQNLSATILLHLYKTEHRKEDFERAEQLIAQQQAQNTNTLKNLCILNHLRGDHNKAKDNAINILFSQWDSESVLGTKIENEYTKYVFLRARNTPVHDYSSVLEEYRLILKDPSFTKLTKIVQGYCHWLIVKILVRQMSWELSPNDCNKLSLLDNAIERLIDLSHNSDEVLQMEFWIWLAELQLNTRRAIPDELSSALTRLKSMCNELPCDVSIPVCYEKALSRVNNIQDIKRKNFQSKSLKSRKDILDLLKENLTPVKAKLM